MRGVVPIGVTAPRGATNVMLSPDRIESWSARKRSSLSVVPVVTVNSVLIVQRAHRSVRWEPSLLVAEMHGSAGCILVDAGGETLVLAVVDGRTSRIATEVEPYEGIDEAIRACRGWRGSRHRPATQRTF